MTTGAGNKLATFEQEVSANSGQPQTGSFGCLAGRPKHPYNKHAKQSY